jgi:hypothetical protein
MSEGNVIEGEGKIVAVLPGTMFRVELTNVTRFWRTFPENCGSTSSRSWRATWYAWR